MHIRYRLWLPLLVGLLAALAATSAYAVTAQDVENKLRAKITKDWSVSNLRVTVVPYDSQARTDKGEFAKIFVAADAAEQKRKHIRIVEFRIESSNVDIDLAGLLKHNDVTVQSQHLDTCHVKLLETDVNKLLALKKTPIKDLRADFGTNQVAFTGRYQFNVKLTGTLEVRKGYEIWFKPTKASVGVLGIPVGIVNQFLAKMNPIIDLRDVPLQPKVKVINIRPGYIGFSS
ncbi:DUF2993 domain-containing protein [bacterium]|nr:DUF2993 domain-containing protein [bacterium]